MQGGPCSPTITSLRLNLASHPPLRYHTHMKAHTVQRTSPLTGLLIIFLKVYKKWLSPCLGSLCRFQPTCSEYAVTALQQHGLFKGLRLTLKRLLRCHPWGSCGHDPVPDHLPGEAGQASERNNIQRAAPVRKRAWKRCRLQDTIKQARRAT